MQRRRDTYRELDHPADLLLEITGTSPPELFENALIAFYDQVTDLCGVSLRRETLIEVREPSMAEALRALLAEALYRFATEGFVATNAEVIIEEPSEGSADNAGASRGAVHVSARLRGNVIDKNRHVLFTEIKAVTYHRLEVVQLPSGNFRATVLFDV